MPDGIWMGLVGAVVGALLLLICVLSMLETAVINARRSRLAQFGSDREIVAAESILENPERFQASAHLGKSLCEALLYASTAILAVRWVEITWPSENLTDIKLLMKGGWLFVLGAMVLAYFFVTLIGETWAKLLAARAPERMLMASAQLIRGYTLFFAPMLWLMSRIARSFVSSTNPDPLSTARAAQSEEEIKLLVEEGAEEGVLEQEEKEMIHSIIEFTDKIARQVMIPRTEVDCVPVDATFEEVLSCAMKSGHSRLPVYEGTLDNVVGVIHAKDLLKAVMDERKDGVLQRMMREPYFVPEAKKLDELLQEFRRSKSQIAIVVDEFGGTSGVVTVEDVLEEIVGEIQDEYDEDEEEPLAHPDVEGTGGLVDGRMTIDDVNEKLDLKLPEGDYDTIAGFVFSLFGRPPAPGESITYENHAFVIEAVDGLRIDKIRIVAATTSVDVSGAELDVT